jgi:flagellar basal body-associated protein FliL
MLRKSNLIIIVLSALLLLVSGYSIYLNLHTISKSEVKEREEILVAALPEINIPSDEIDEIVVLKSKAGIYPYMYNVAVNKKNGTQIIYGWADRDKSRVIKE